MTLWWKRNKPKKEKTLEEKQLELKSKQPGSLLQAFVQYVERHKKDELELSVSFESNGVLTLYCQFKNEKNYEISMGKDTSLAVQRDPELMIMKLYENGQLNRVIQEFQRMEGIQEELNQWQWKIDNARMVYKGKASIRAHEAMLEALELASTKESRQREVDKYMKKIWFNSPYFAERLHAVYKEFWVQHTFRQTADPVEADLLAILEDEDLSGSTKQKAENMLSDYRAKKAMSAEDKVAHKENQALLTLSTIERHYLKGSEGVE